MAEVQRVNALVAQLQQDPAGSSNNVVHLLGRLEPGTQEVGRRGRTGSASRQPLALIGAGCPQPQSIAAAFLPRPLTQQQHDGYGAAASDASLADPCRRRCLRHPRRLPSARQSRG